MHGLIKVGLDILFHVSFFLTFPPSGAIGFISMQDC